jgi:hypothetical protein
MRTMNIPPFPDRIEIADVESFANARLAEEFKLCEQSSMLAGYVLYPANEEARIAIGSELRSAADPLRLNLKGMRRSQYRWLRAADVFHLYYDLASGGHPGGHSSLRASEISIRA